MKLWAWLLAVALVAVFVAAGTIYAGEGRGKGKTEEKVTMDQVPAAVKATILKEAGDNKITEIEKETKNGKVVYEAELKHHHAEIAQRIVGTVVVDESHLTEDQLLAKAREVYAGLSPQKEANHD